MVKKLLIVMLSISLLIEAYITFLCFFNPAKAVASMNENFTAQETLPIFLIGWFVLLISLLMVYVIYAVVKEIPGYEPIIYILGFWWIGIGIAIYLFNGTWTNLLTDSLKGLILVVLLKSKKY